MKMYTFSLPCTHNRHFSLAVFWSIEIYIRAHNLNSASYLSCGGLVGALPLIALSLYPQAPIFQTSKIHSCFFLKSEKSRVQYLLFFPRDCRPCSAPTLLFLQTKKTGLSAFNRQSRGVCGRAQRQFATAR